MSIKSFANSLKGPSPRPPYEATYIYVLALLCGYFAADLSILSVRPEMLPKEAPPSRPQSRKKGRISRSEYGVITKRNGFDSAGEIPPTLASTQMGQEPTDIDGPATLSKLPIQLFGTIVHLNPIYSVATINISNGNKTNAYKVGEKIGKLAKITLIERRKVTFRNINNQRLEYIEIPEDTKFSFGLKSTKPKPAKKGNVSSVGNNEFVLKRSTIEKFTSDLSSILKQARMIPVRLADGSIDGFRFASIEAGSIYEELGFQKNDIIKEVEGEPITSPTGALELYQKLKTSNQISIVIERNGSSENFNYTVE